MYVELITTNKEDGICSFERITNVYPQWYKAMQIRVPKNKIKKYIDLLLKTRHYLDGEDHIGNYSILIFGDRKKCL